MNKKTARLRRARRARAKLRELAVPRLCVNRSLNNIYAQVISSCGSKVLASASTLDKELQGKVKHGGNKEAAAMVGKLIAERASKAGVTKLGFDRSGFKYHGRIKALADAAREGGMDF